MRWESFFGNDNSPDMRWDALSKPDSPLRKVLQPFIDAVERNAPVAALPRVRAGDERVQWYVGWRSESDARLAADLLAAFLGRTYADMREPLRPLEPSDEAERAFADEFGRRAYVVEVAKELRASARERLQALTKCLLDRPIRRAPKVRPVGRILRDLEFALQAGDNAQAAEQIAVLRVGGHVDELNLVFLELRRFAATQNWGGLLAHEAVGGVLALRSVPWRVRQALIQCLYHSYLEPLVSEGDVASALRRVGELLSNYGVAFSSKRNLAGIESDVCFLLAGHLRGGTDAVTTAMALERIAAYGYVAFADEFRGRVKPANERESKAPTDVVNVDSVESGSVSCEPVPATPPPTTIVLAQAALGDGDLDRAYLLALDAPISAQRVKVLLQCTRLLNDEAASMVALDAFDRLADDDRAEVGALSWCCAVLSELRGPSDRVGALPVPTTSWLAWFKRLRGAELWAGAVSRVEKGVAEWDIEEIAASPDAIACVVDILGQRLEEWAALALREALPYVLEAFIKDPPDPRLSPVFASLFELLATDDALSLSSMYALIRLSHVRLAAAPLAYKATLDVVATVLESADTPRAARLVADALELLIMTPCASADERSTAAMRLAKVACRRWTRVDAVDQQLLRTLCTELGVDRALPSPQLGRTYSTNDDNDWSALSGQFIAFYSLESDAVARAVSVLGKACPEARFRAFSEHANTAPMRDAARTADLFVLATRSATHAATGAIMQNRRFGAPVEYAHSKSSSALIQAVRRWVEKLNNPRPDSFGGA